MKKVNIMETGHVALRNHKMKSKKGIQTDPLTMIIAFIILAILLGFVIFGPIAWTREKGAELKKISDIDDSACKTSGQTKELRGIDFQDSDNDLRPDLLCDICYPGNNDKDKDADGVPDLCDADASNARIGFCKDEKGCKDNDCEKVKACKEGSHCGPLEKSGKIIKLDEEKFQCDLTKEYTPEDWFDEAAALKASKYPLLIRKY